MTKRRNRQYDNKYPQFLNKLLLDDSANCSTYNSLIFNAQNGYKHIQNMHPEGVLSVSNTDKNEQFTFEQYEIIVEPFHKTFNDVDDYLFKEIIEICRNQESRT